MHTDMQAGEGFWILTRRFAHMTTSDSLAWNPVQLAASLSPLPADATCEDDFTAKSAHLLAGKPLTEAAVLITLVPRETGTAVLLTQRTEHLRDHPGQISFPGGRQEATDATPAAAALREAREEIGLSPDLPTILGYLPDYRTATGFLIHPVVSWLPPPLPPLLPDAFEVAEVFEAPLDALFDPANHRQEQIIYRGTRHAYHVITCEAAEKSRRIWGATAGMLLMLRRRLLP
jgi:8-oxo-dGTP pyrophosphatase MutT (NUDIX family)